MRLLVPTALSILACAVALSAQNPLDARTAKRIAEKTDELNVARQELEVANEALQRRYAELAETWVQASTGQAGPIYAELEQALAEIFAEVRTAAMESNGSSARTGAAWDRAQAKALRRFETPFLELLLPQIREAGGSLAREAAASLQDWTVTDFVRALAERAFPASRPFHEIWNETLAPRVEEAQRYVEARAALSGIETELLVLHDPKKAHAIGAPPGMAKIPGSAVTIESRYGYEDRRRKARVQTFLIDLREVTHGEYWNHFHVALTDAAARERHLPRNADGVALWNQERATGAYQPDESLMALPVTGIDAISAAAYAAAVGKRLPTEAEWIAAASGSTRGGTMYAWGDEYREGRANDLRAGLGAPMAADSLPEGRSAFGLHHVCGNVREWTATTAAGEDVAGDVPPDALLAVRGGGFRESADAVSLYWRWKLPASGSRSDDLGFRCARDWRP